jgi:hypothetical protein
LAKVIPVKDVSDDISRLLIAAKLIETVVLTDESFGKDKLSRPAIEDKDSVPLIVVSSGIESKVMLDNVDIAKLPPTLLRAGSSNSSRLGSLAV